MKAAWFNRFGSPAESLEVGQYAKPEVGHGDVLVRVHASGVNPSDVKKRAGAFPNLLDTGSVIPHSDGAGIIEAVGRGVPKSRIGERVWVYQAQYGRMEGTAAEYVALPSERAPTLPDTTSFAEGACMGIPAMTAHRCVFADGSVQGQTVLVTGGAGRVGHYAIQWAKHAGATVIATASNPEAEQHAYDAGADAVINHRAEDFADQVKAANGGQAVDRVVEVEFGANLANALKVLKIGGVIATYSSTVVPEPTLPFRDMMFQDITLRMVIVYAMPEQAKQDAIEDINWYLAENKLQHRIAHTVPLEEVAKSHELIEEAGFYGCVVVEVE